METIAANRSCVGVIVASGCNSIHERTLYLSHCFHLRGPISNRHSEGAFSETPREWRHDNPTPVVRALGNPSGR